LTLDDFNTASIQLTFHLKISKIYPELGAPAFGTPLDFVHPVHHIAMPLILILLNDDLILNCPAFQPQTNKKSRYRKDDRTMRPIYECPAPENCA